MRKGLFLLMAAIVTVNGCSRLGMAHRPAGKTGEKEPKAEIRVEGNGTSLSGVEKEDTGGMVLDIAGFALNNAEVRQSSTPDGGKAVILKDKNSTAETTVQLVKGKYYLRVYAIGGADGQGRISITIGGGASQTFRTRTAGAMTLTEKVRFVRETDGPCTILLGHGGGRDVELRRLVIKKEGITPD